ncbi:glucuronate isomerase [Alisedimentitalea sp. MJ-SS2]|uniref:glucuronate isomerase n=1 Tax=Aliisedimentitalea sp. MJ-SS2 TaxID=3049795 RepID=UPI00290E6A36|nr:glucuronate isomerase [Alisedimentitalea sp. MJ-SS2]MDU8927034.1 glucuronate isomerase [Alisedimentitalea sp. MJ-SS2]
MPFLDEDRLFPSEPGQRAVARELYSTVRDAPLVCPHGHTEARWFAEDLPFPDPSALFVIPDHYVFRMLCSAGIALTDLGVPRVDGGPVEADPRRVWRLFARNYHLFRGTPSRLWLDHAFQDVFGCDTRLTADNADWYFDHISDCLTRAEFRPRALYDRFGIEAISTTDSPIDDLRWHRQLRESDWAGRIVPTYRPDTVIDPEHEGFIENIETLGALTGTDISSWQAYLDAHRIRRAAFKSLGATATDHGHPSARTADLPTPEAAALYATVLAGKATPDEAELFRAQMLTEMARMSLEDGLVMQLHAGSHRNHSSTVMARHGRDMGFDIPGRTSFVEHLKPLLNAVGMKPRMTLILFTLDETTYGRELAPLAGAYPALRLGPAWWFFDSFEGMLRYRRRVTETAGFYNTVGFNDDTRAFCSIPARHDVARRVDSTYLAEMVTTGRLDIDEAHDLAHELAGGLARKAYKL